MGYPADDEIRTDAYWTLLVVTVPTQTDLCVNGTAESSRKRRDAKPITLLLRNRRTTGGHNYSNYSVSAVSVANSIPQSLYCLILFLNFQLKFKSKKDNNEVTPKFIFMLTGLNCATDHFTIILESSLIIKTFIIWFVNDPKPTSSSHRF